MDQVGMGSNGAVFLVQSSEVGAEASQFSVLLACLLDQFGCRI